MIKPIVHTWGTCYPEQIAQRHISNYTSISQEKLDDAVERLNNGIRSNKIVPLVGLTDDFLPFIERRINLINGCLVTHGRYKEPPKNAYLHILAEPSNNEGFSKTLDSLCLHL